MEVAKEKELVPELRFKEFDEGWKRKKLGDISNFSKGKGISKADINENGKLSCIRYGELYTRYTEVIDEVYSRTDVSPNQLVLSEENDVIIPASGETQIDIATASCVLNAGIALSGDLNIIKSKVNGVFLSYYLNNKRKLDIAKLSQGISVVHIYASQLKTLKINIPKEKEQQKIASFLSKVDEKITLLTKKKELLDEYKKGVTQKIFKQEIRFKILNETGELVEPPKWEKRKLGDYLSIPEKVSPAIIDVNKILTVRLNLNGVYLNQRTESLKIGATKYIKRKRGQFIYGKQNLFNGAFGIVPDEFDGFLSSGDVPSLNIDNSKMNPQFLIQFFGRKSFYNQLETIASGSGSKRIHESTLLSHKVIIPSMVEQTKIANFLSSIDKKIRVTPLNRRT